MLITTHGPTLGIDLDACPTTIVVRSRLGEKDFNTSHTKVRYVVLGALGLLDVDLAWTSLRLGAVEVDAETRLDYATWGAAFDCGHRTRLFWARRSPGDSKVLIAVQQSLGRPGARVTVGVYNDDRAYEMLHDQPVPPETGLITFDLPRFDPADTSKTPIELELARAQVLQDERDAAGGQVALASLALRASRRPGRGRGGRR